MQSYQFNHENDLNNNLILSENAKEINEIDSRICCQSCRSIVGWVVKNGNSNLWKHKIKLNDFTLSLKESVSQFFQYVFLKKDLVLNDILNIMICYVS